MKNPSYLVRKFDFLVIPAFFVFIATACYAQERNVPVEPSEERLNRQHQPGVLIDAIGLKEGMVIADIGAGRGRLTVWFATRVGNNGKVYANDIDKEALDYLENRCRKNNFNNVETFLGRVDNPMLPPGTVDIAFMISTYHHLEKPVEMLRNTTACLKENGTLIIVERDPVKTGQTSRESTSAETIERQADEAGYYLLKTDRELLERDNVYFFKVKKE